MTPSPKQRLGRGHRIWGWANEACGHRCPPILDRPVVRSSFLSSSIHKDFLFHTTTSRFIFKIGDSNLIIHLGSPIFRVMNLDYNIQAKTQYGHVVLKIIMEIPRTCCGVIVFQW